MTRNIVTVQDDELVAEVARRFADLRIHGAPVVDRKDRLVGVVSTSDIISNELKVGHKVVSEVDYYGRPDLATRGEWARAGMQVEDYADTPIRDIMTPIVITAPADATIAQVAAILGTNRIHRVLITEGERMVGVVSALDLIGLIPARATPAAGEVLLATDLGPEAAYIAGRAAALAEEMGCRLAVVHITPDLLTLMQAYGERPELPAVQKGFEELALARLGDLCQRLDPTPFDLVARTGDPAAAVLRVIEERRPAYVVIGAQRKATERIAGIGSVAERILAGSPAPVLIMPRRAG